MLAKKCDICGNYFDESLDKESINMISFGNRIGQCCFANCKELETFDACPNCVTSVYLHIKSKEKKRRG